MLAVLVAGTVAAVALLVRAQPAVALEPAHLVAGFPRGQAVLDTAGPRCLLLEVYVASTPEQSAQGLMFVETMAEFEGMYFGRRTPAELAFWMKNTILPLDLLFIRADGTVGRIARDAVPFSMTTIPSGGPVMGALEVNAGFARRWRVEPGTRLRLY